MSEQFCKSCNADDPPHAPGCYAAALHDMHEKGKLNGLLQAQAIALQWALDADSPDERQSAEVVAGLIAGAAYGLALHKPTSFTAEVALTKPTSAQDERTPQAPVAGGK